MNMDQNKNGLNQSPALTGMKQDEHGQRYIEVGDKKYWDTTPVKPLHFTLSHRWSVIGDQAFAEPCNRASCSVCQFKA